MTEEELKVDHYYVFYIDEKKNNIYERTCGDEYSAKQRVEELKKRHPDATYYKNELPKEYYY